MSDRALIATGAAGAVLAAICCAAPLLAAVLPFAVVGAWMEHAGLLVIPLMMVAGLVLVAWRLHHQPATATGRQTRTHQEGAEP